MAPLKLEDNIRDQFENREISPSADAWKKLSDQLDEKTSKKKRGLGIWWAIAAGIAGLALIGSLLFSSDPSLQQNEIVIEEPKPEAPNTETVIPVIPLEQEQDQKQEDIVAVEQQNEKSEAIDKPIDKAPQKSEEKTAIAQAPKTQKPKSEAVIIVTPKEIDDTAISASDGNATPTDSQDAVAAKVDEVVGKIKDMEAANAQITEAEIAALLEAAQKELKAKSLINMETLKVDANALLMDVEYDLERSFRDKVFDALGEGYNKIRTAMATRNN